ncbi:MAG TPA: hypothetical protein VGL58_15510 [Caulobacteraceae bacterium]|jgi:hypothetical protein
MKLRNLLIAVAGLAVSIGGASAASAATPWQLHHPARVEVNQRLDHLNGSIRVERHDGRITALQAARLHERVRMIRQHERIEASFHRGHLTRFDQRGLNGQAGGVRGHL